MRLRLSPALACPFPFFKGGLKTLNPGPRTPTTDQVRWLPMDQSTDYHYEPLNGPPPQ